MNEIFFLNKYCRDNKHKQCQSSWTGFDFQIFCKCDCHKRREATDGFRGPTPVAISHTTQAESREDD
ncbi:MAG: hypothetical protein E6K97_04930 [Thaumarchaeota archaeon]|nr:MAG: hypothetical protein E6K97_04930 [Nitrososphaerota archaeon]